MSVHPKGRVCILNEWERDALSRGVKPDHRDHRHISQTNAFYMSRRAVFGDLLRWVFVGSSTKKTSRPIGCYVEVAGTVEYVHFKKRIKLDLENIYALGEKIATEKNLKFVRRKEWEYLRYL